MRCGWADEAGTEVYDSNADGDKGEVDEVGVVLTQE